MDLYGALALVDAVDDPVGPAPRGVIAVEGFIQWLARAVRVDSERTVDRLHGSGSDIERQVLVEVVPSLPGENDGVPRFGFSACVRVACHDGPRRRRASSALS